MLRHDYCATNTILVLLTCGLLIGAGGLAVFMWTLRAGQYEDLDGSATQILFDDD